MEQVGLDVAGTKTRHFRDSRAQPEDSLSPRSQTDGGMAQAVRELSSAVARERDKKVARRYGWNSLADENIESEACGSIDSDDSEYLEYVRELEERYAL